MKKSGKIIQGISFLESNKMQSTFAKEIRDILHFLIFFRGNCQYFPHYVPFFPGPIFSQFYFLKMVLKHAWSHFFKKMTQFKAAAFSLLYFLQVTLLLFCFSFCPKWSHSSRIMACIAYASSQIEFVTRRTRIDKSNFFTRGRDDIYKWRYCSFEKVEKRAPKVTLFHTFYDTICP